MTSTWSRRAAQCIWAEGWADPLDWSVRTILGPFTASDRCPWHTRDRAWSAELRRSRNREHVYLAVFHDGTYLGRYDATGGHAASIRCCVCQLRSPQLPLRLVA
jgi:hypothetical protein